MRNKKDSTQASARSKTPHEVTTIAGDLMDEIQAAQFLGIRPRTLRDWRVRRGLDHYKPTHKITLYKKSDILAWLDRHRVATIARHSAPASPSARPSCKAAKRQGGQNA